MRQPPARTEQFLTGRDKYPFSNE